MQRGLYSHVFSGYALHFLENNLSGIYISTGIGYLQHQIFIDTKNQNIPQLDEEMKKGYDRFSNGLSTKFSIDYKYYNKNEQRVFAISTFKRRFNKSGEELIYRGGLMLTFKL